MNTSAPVARPKRRYRMGARAAATAATRKSIADAWNELFRELQYDDITLDLVAARAGVTVQTVIRHFGSKEALFTAVVQEATELEAALRGEAPVGDIDVAVRTVVARYEAVGELVLRLLAQEDRFPAIGERTDEGRRMHYEWVEHVFAPHLAGARGADRRRLRAQLVALTDVFTWKLLRRDHGLGRRQTESAMAEMVQALVARAG